LIQGPVVPRRAERSAMPSSRERRRQGQDEWRKYHVLTGIGRSRRTGHRTDALRKPDVEEASTSADKKTGHRHRRGATQKRSSAGTKEQRDYEIRHPSHSIDEGSNSPSNYQRKMRFALRITITSRLLTNIKELRQVENQVIDTEGSGLLRVLTDEEIYTLPRFISTDNGFDGVFLPRL